MSLPPMAAGSHALWSHWSMQDSAHPPCLPRTRVPQVGTGGALDGREGLGLADDLPGLPRGGLD